MTVQELAKAAARSALSDRPIFPGDADYDRFRRVWNGLFDRRPAMILRARTIGDIRSGIALARTFALPLALRGGGHSLPGFSTCDDGIVLDLSAMHAVTVDANARRAQVQAGALLGQLDAAGAGFGLVVPAGVVSHTGAAGLTLGGGMGWLSRRFGLTIDSLEQVRLVLADGSVIEADTQNEADLFWALRGGGGNFGVVTDFRFRMHAIGDVAMGSWHYPFGEAASTLRALAAAARSAPRTVTTSFTLGPDGLDLTAFVSGPQAAWSQIAGFGQLAGGGTGGPLRHSFVDFQRRNDAANDWGVRVYARGGFFADLDDTAIRALLSAFDDAPGDGASIYVIQLGGAVADVADEATAYSGRRAGYYWIVDPAWNDPAEDARYMAWGRSNGRRLAAIASGGNYVNEQSDTGADVAHGAYGPDKYRRLAAIKARVDPQNLFRLNQNIRPAP